MKPFLYQQILFLTVPCCKIILLEDVSRANENLPKNLDFNIHLKPIISDKCFSSHGQYKAKIVSGLLLHGAETAFAKLPESPEKYVIKPGNIRKYEVVKRILATDKNEGMPTPKFIL